MANLLLLHIGLFLLLGLDGLHLKNMESSQAEPRLDALLLVAYVVLAVHPHLAVHLDLTTHLSFACAGAIQNYVFATYLTCFAGTSKKQPQNSLRSAFYVNAGGPIPCCYSCLCMDASMLVVQKLQRNVV